MPPAPAPTQPATPAIDVPDAIRVELDRPYEITDAHRERYARDGYLKLPNFWSPELLAFFDPIVTENLHRHNPLRDVPMEERTTYQKAFIQVGNLWELDETVRMLSHSKRAARAAAELMGVRGVRMYHDQALYKEAGGGFTPWHVDQYYWPVDTTNTTTIWFPFTEVPIEKGPLMFGRGSHHRHIAREEEISDQSEKLIDNEVKSNRIQEDFEPYGLGEVTFHAGWTLHRAGPNQTDDARRVMTIIYLEQDAKLTEPKHKNHASDHERWSPSTKVGEVLDDPLNPVLYSRDGKAS